MIGIKETKELLEFGFAMQKAIAGALADDKINFMDAKHLLAIIKPAAQGLGGISRVKAELLDLDDDEQAELVAFAAERFDLENDELEKLIEDTMDQVLDLVQLSARYGANAA